MNNGPASPKSESNQSTVTAHEQVDAISAVAPQANAPTTVAKDQILEVKTLSGDDPLDLGRHRRSNVSQRQMKIDHPQANKKKMKKFYNRQNALIDQFLQSGDEERLAALDTIENGPKVKFAVNASFTVNFFLFVIQLYAAISTGSLSLFATAADAFMDLVSSIVMLVTSRMASRPSVYKYPVGRTRIETIGIIMFCCLMTTVAIQLIVSAARLYIRRTVADKYRLNLGEVSALAQAKLKTYISSPSYSWLSQVSYSSLAIQACSFTYLAKLLARVACASIVSSSAAIHQCMSSSSITETTLSLIHSVS